MAESVTLTRKAAAEAVGTALLLATVVGSGIMGERLSGGNVAIALLANTLATGAGLVALILTFGPISGGHSPRRRAGLHRRPACGRSGRDGALSVASPFTSKGRAGGHRPA